MSDHFERDFLYTIEVYFISGENDGQSFCQIERFSFIGIVECLICVVHSKREFFNTIKWIYVARYLTVSLRGPVRTLRRGCHSRPSLMGWGG